MKKLKDLKQGEYAKCINSNTVGFTKGGFYKLTRDFDDGFGQFYDNDKTKNGWQGNNYSHFEVADFAKAKVKSISKFKAKKGDWEVWSPKNLCILYFKKEYSRDQVRYFYFKRTGVKFVDTRTHKIK